MPRNNDMQRRSVREEHGFGDGYYSMLPDLQPHPVMRCLCGAFPDDVCNSWTEAGLWLDRHIVDAMRKDDIRYHELVRKNGPPPAAPAARAGERSK